MPAERGLKAGEMDAVFKIEIGGDHGAVKCGQAELVEQMQLHAGQVAVGEEGLGMLPMSSRSRPSSR